MPPKTLLVLASARDNGARQLAALWAGAGARLLLPRDLSRPGWRYQPGHIEESIAMLQDEPIAACNIVGVLTRIGRIAEDELLEISPEDRAYTAQEMTSFLTAWISALPCPVLNRPGPVCLSGPNWRPEQWIHAAAQEGVPVVPVRRHIAPSNPYTAPSSNAQVTVLVVGNKCLGAEDSGLRENALRIARRARVELLAVNFAGSDKHAPFVSANLWPDILRPDFSRLGFADAVRDYLAGPSGRS